MEVPQQKVGPEPKVLPKKKKKVTLNEKLKFLISQFPPLPSSLPIISNLKMSEELKNLIIDFPKA